MPAAAGPVLAAPPQSEPSATGGPPDGTPAGSEFAPLLRQVREAGLLRRRPGWYAAMIAANAVAVAAVWTAVVLVGAGGSWWVLALALPAAVLSARSGFVGHDAGHQQIAAGRQANRAIALLHGNLLLGMGAGWWIDKHNRHHANPNHVGKDPDVGGRRPGVDAGPGACSARGSRAG